MTEIRCTSASVTLKVWNIKSVRQRTLITLRRSASHINQALGEWIRQPTRPRAPGALYVELLRGGGLGGGSSEFQSCKENGRLAWPGDFGSILT